MIGRKIAAGLIGLSMLAAACGSDDDGSSSATTTAPPATAAPTVTDATGDTTPGDTTPETTPAVTNEKTVKIGVLQSQTGAFGTAGTAGLGATKVGVQMVNDAGGVVIGDTRYTFEIVSQDSATDPAKAATGAQSLLRDEGVKFFFGPIETPSVVAVEPFIKESGETIWVGGSTYLPGQLEANSAANGFEKVFATNPSAATVYPASVKGALEFLPDAKTAVLLWPAGAGLDPFAEMIQQAMKDNGLEVLDTVRYDPTTTDFSPILTGIKAKNPDLLYTGTAAGAVQAIVSQSIAIGGAFKAVISQGTAEGIGLTGDNGGPTPFPYLYIVNRAADQNISTLMVDLLEEYEKVNGAAPDPAVAQYAVEFTLPVLLLAEAMKKAGTVEDTEAIAKALAEVKTEGFAGDPIGFNSNHVLAAPIAVCQVADGKTTCKLEGGVS